MRLLFFCPAWGSRDLPVEVLMEKVKNAGYDGVEMSLPWAGDPLQARVLKGIAGQGLDLIAQHHETIDSDPEKHLAEYGRRLEYLAAARPRFINSQTGRDWFSIGQNQRLIAAAREISERSGVPILHETHRGRFSFNAHGTAEYLRADPGLRLAVDFSHWCAVSESLLEDQPEAVALAISRADHIHARVGYPEGPQISDPRAPEWKPALDAHLGWWDRIIQAHKEKGTPVLTITPEFGPAPYMPLLPYTRMPVANQWEVNVYMMGLLRERYRLV
jgi:sugar phosphate isomerase/epimerase